MDQPTPMTVFGKKLLDEELDNLIKVDREKIKTAISEARALGDLKENADYHAAKERQSLIEGRIQELQHKLANATVIDTSKLNGPKITFGATVKLLDIEKEKSSIFQIVGTDEADSKLGKISYSSPLAKAMIGKSCGDTVVVNAPKGEIEYEVEEVQYK